MRLLNCFPANNTANGPTENSDRAVLLQAVLVTFLLSTSCVLVKISLQDMPALAFAGLYYVLAFLCLLPLVLLLVHVPALHKLPVKWWGWLFALGWLFLGEATTPKEIFNMLLVARGTLIVQLRIRKRS